MNTARLTHMVALRRTSPLYPFEPIEASPHYRLQSFDKRIESILAKGYPMRPAYLFVLDKPLPWAHADRTVAYNLQAFEPLAPLLMAHSMTKRHDCLDAALAFAQDWLKQVRPPTKEELAGEWQEKGTNDFLWYDMAVGLRCYRLAYIVDVLLRAPHPDNAALERWFEILHWHCQILMRDEAFSSHNNHGLYQALGQIAMSRRFRDIPTMQACFIQGEERLHTMLSQQFFEDGVHREHSPGYHWMILGTLQEAMRVGLISRDDHVLFISRIEDAMAWFIQPNKMLPAFGDTDAGGVASGYYDAKDFIHPHLRFALSQGALGSPPSISFKHYPDAGYAILRKYGSKNNAIGSYLAQAAGFHSLTHKHADHLTFVWHDKGEDIVVDSGRYGYKGKTERGSVLWSQGFWYADPKRIYVEKTRAHNCVEIDGLDYPRRKTKPFGSALRRTAQAEGVVAIESECRHFGSIRHARVLFVCPEKFLLVFDWLKDNAGGLHDFRQWFHLGANLDVKVVGDKLTAMREGKAFASVSSLLPDVSLETLARGQAEPELQGWVSHEKGGVLLPNWAFAMTAAQRPHAMFATLFSLHPDYMPWEESRVTASGQSGNFSWQDRAGYHTLSFTRRPQEEIALRYRRRKEPDA